MKGFPGRTRVHTLIMSLTVVAIGCIAANGSYGRDNTGLAGFSLRGTCGEFGRGVTNVAFCWLEVPCEVETRVRGNSPGDPFSIVANVFDIAFGTIGGTFRTAGRAAGGAAEIGLSPFPPYDPLMDPAYPPYVKLAARSGGPKAESREIHESEIQFDEGEGTYTQTLTEDMPFRPGGSLRVTTSNGPITVSSWDEPHLRVTALKRMMTRRVSINILGFQFRSGRAFGSEEEAEQYFSKLDVDVTGDENNVEVRTRFPSRKRKVSVSVSYEIQVPREAELVLATSNGAVFVENIDGTVKLKSSNGKLECENVTGSVEATTSNGKVSLTGISGSIDAHTSNGSIKIVHTDPLDDSDIIACKTSNGSIKLELHKDSSFNLEAHTSNGRIATEFPIKMKGELSRQHVSGTVGNGGPSVRLTTSNGSISIDTL